MSSIIKFLFQSKITVAISWRKITGWSGIFLMNNFLLWTKRTFPSSCRQRLSFCTTIICLDRWYLYTSAKFFFFSKLQAIQTKVLNDMRQLNSETTKSHERRVDLGGTVSWSSAILQTRQRNITKTVMTSCGQSCNNDSEFEIFTKKPFIPPTCTKQFKKRNVYRLDFINHQINNLIRKDSNTVSCV